MESSLSKTIKQHVVITFTFAWLWYIMIDKGNLDTRAQV